MGAIISSLANSIGKVGAPLGGFLKAFPPSAPGVLGGLAGYIAKELIAPRPVNQGEDEFLRKLKNPYKPPSPVDVEFETPNTFTGGQEAGVAYKVLFEFEPCNGVVEIWDTFRFYLGPIRETKIEVLYQTGNCFGGAPHYAWRVTVVGSKVDGSPENPYTPVFYDYRNIKFLGIERWDGQPDTSGNPPPLQPGVQQNGSANPVPGLSPLPPEAPYSDEEFLEKFGAPPRLNPNLFNPAANSKAQPVPKGDTFPDAKSLPKAQAPPVNDPAADVPKVGAVPTSANNTYTRTYTNTGSDAWGSTPGTRVYSPGISGAGAKAPPGVNTAGGAGVNNNGDIVPLNPPATPANPPVVSVPSPTDTLITGLGSTLALILDQTSKTKIKEATSEGVCETTAPGKCLNNLINNPNWLAGLNAALAGLSNAGNAAILAKLDLMQAFAEKAWKSLHLDKALQIANTALLVHNAMMLSRNLGQSLGDVTSQILNAFGVKDEKDQPLDVNEIIGDKITSVITTVIGQQAYTDITSTFNKANRILTAAQGVVWAIRGMKDAATEVGEVLGSWIAKIGNNMMSQGLFEDRTFNWMNENPQFRQHYSKFVDRIDNLEEATGQISSIVSNTTEFTEELNNAVTNTTTLIQVMDEFDEPKETAETAAKDASASPDISNADLNKKEDGE